MPIIPQHEQHYPYKLLPYRLEEYVSDDKPPTVNRAFAKLVTGKEVMDVVQQQQAKLGISSIDPRYFIGTCFHESGCLNEWDTEVATASSPLGFQSVGPYQIGQEEALRFGFKLSDMVDLVNATRCMIRLAEYNRGEIRHEAGLANTSPDPDYVDSQGRIWSGGTMRAYLAICHNHGVGYVRTTIYNYGLDWNAYKKRNPTDNIVAHGYGDDCITGGDHYPGTGTNNLVGFRALKLTNPPMTGEDVRELQRHLKISTDGIFGPQTQRALLDFQKSHGLTSDGVCSTLTWTQVLQATT